MKARPAFIACCVACIAASCAPIGVGAPLFRASPAVTETASMTEPQSCAVGYDLARAIYENMPAGRSDIVVREGQGACERFAVDYLRRSGFAIRATGGAPFIVETRPLGPSQVLAIARIGDRYSASRLYELAQGGVLAAGPASFQEHAQTAQRRVRSERARRPADPAPVREER